LGKGHVGRCAYLLPDLGFECIKIRENLHIDCFFRILTGNTNLRVRKFKKNGKVYKYLRNNILINASLSKPHPSPSPVKRGAFVHFFLPSPRERGWG
jgi:hypothetical protein